MGTPGTRTQPVRTATDTPNEQGKQLAHSVGESTKQVAGTVKEEASNVAGEVSTQVRSLAGQAADQLRGQVDQQRSRAAQTLRTSSDEFASLADKGEHSQLTSELTRRVADQARSVAAYVERTSPGEALEQVRSFARRRPGAFLLAAAFAGMVTGRLLTSTTAAGDASSASTPSTTYRPTGTSSDFLEPQPPPLTPAPLGGTPVTGSVPAGTATPGATGRGDTTARRDVAP